MPAESKDAQAPMLLRIPPFPGAKVRSFEATEEADFDPAVIDLLREARVGGSYWGPQPALPAAYVLCRDARSAGAAEALQPNLPLVQWSDGVVLSGAQRVTGDCDPWHMLAGAQALVCDPDDPVRQVAALLEVPAYIPDGTGGLTRAAHDVAELVAPALSCRFASPFGTDELSAAEAIALCAHWRALIDANRNIGAALGFAFWKQEAVGALLWGGDAPVAFVRTLPRDLGSRAVALWRSKAPAGALSALEAAGNPVVEVEDGFLRSQGLGADCVPPLSITVDRLGAYFDPAQPSELERLLEEGPFSPLELERARKLRAAIIAARLGKYEQGGDALPRPAGTRRHILVPGQVEDDRSVQTGGCGLDSNLELLRRVRAAAPDAYIIYKPHPDVLAGHRKGTIPAADAAMLADEIATDTPISSLLEMVDEVHVNTSLAGFEALLRGKKVTTHGVPFYAGWGLTTDLGPVPARRTAQRSLDELVAATLLLYPRYLDPVSGLPCPAEVVVARLSAGQTRQGGAVVRARRLQGKVMVRLKALWS